MRARAAAWRWNPLGACFAGNALQSTRELQKRRRRVWRTRMVRPTRTPLLDVLRASQMPTVPRTQVLLNTAFLC